MSKIKGLGRGLSALISTELPTEGSAAKKLDLPDSVQIRYIELSKITPNPNQPRTTFSESEIAELSDSIKEKGVIQPVLLRKTGFDSFQIVAGERRFRAAGKAGLAFIPAVVKDISDVETLELAIIENVQRQDLNPIEEARAYQRLIDEFSLSQAEIAQRVGKDRATIANLLRVLKLNPSVVSMIENGEISLGHGKVLLTIRDEKAQANLAQKVKNEALSVRELEGLVAKVGVLDRGRAIKPKKTKDQGHLSSIESELRTKLGTKVKITGSGRGKILIEYFSEEELSRLVDLILR
jgi:ParB family chromosome partitioning protein